MEASQIKLLHPDLNSKKILTLALILALILGCFWFLYHMGGRPLEKKAETSPAPRGKSAAYYHNSVVVLMYHNVDRDLTGHGAISPEKLIQQLDLLRKKGFHFIPVDRLAAFLTKKGTVPDNAVVLTFDDGYQEVYGNVYPILKKRQIPATIFIMGGVIGKPGSLTWQQVKEMDSGGLVTIGGHTYGTHTLVQCGMKRTQPATVARIYNPATKKQETLPQYISRMTADSNREQQIFQSRLGHKTKYYAYPYGAYTPKLIEILQKSGYRYLFTVIRGINSASQDRARIMRIDAGQISPQQLFSTIRQAALSAKSSRLPGPAWLLE